MLALCLVEDNKKLGNLVQQELIDEGYACDRYQSVEDIDASMYLKYHIFLLDIMLPGKDGVSFATQLRNDSKVGIIFLTAKSTLDDKSSGFHAGADDYLTKPFTIKELCLRIDALAERLEPTKFFQYEDIYLDAKNRVAKRNDTLVHLTPFERELVGCLLGNRGFVCQRADLIEHIWGADELFGMSRSLDVIVVNVRKKLGKKFIDTVPGIGYKLGIEK